MRRSNSGSVGRRQTWSPGTDATQKRRRRKHRPPTAEARRKLLFCVVIFVILWLWFIMMVVSWISSDASTGSMTNNNGGISSVDAVAGRKQLRGGQRPDLNSLEVDDDEHNIDDSIDEKSVPKNNTRNEAADDRQRHRDFRPPVFERYTEKAPTCDAISAQDVDFTLVTQLSSDRVWMLKYHCERWGSKMSVAILTNRTHADVEKELIDMGCDTNELSLQVLSADLYPADDYPVNVLRNMALSRVTTSHVMYVDVDFWESQALHLSLTLPQVRSHLAQNHKHALVVPAFQLNRQCREWRECPENNIPKMPKTRKEMLKLLKKKQGYPFDPTNRGGHGSTMYASWVTKQGQPASMLTLPCVNSNRYEPYLAFRYCRELPPFQEEFSGFGKNKMSMMMQMLRSGYRLDQLGGEAFLVHYPHLDSKSRQDWNEGPKELEPYKVDGKWHKRQPKDVKNVDWLKYKRGRVDATFVAFRKWLAREIPDERIIHKCTDAEDDDAKLWYDRDGQ